MFFNYGCDILKVDILLYEVKIMIFGNIKDIPMLLPYMPEALQKGLEYIAKTDFSKMENGNYEIEGKAIYAGVNTYMTEPVEDRKPEKHRTYIDVQFMGAGKETLWYKSVTEEDVVTEDYLDERDVCFYGAVKELNCVNLEQGDFAILFPWEIHRPNCDFQGGSSNQVQKIVVKIKA